MTRRDQLILIDGHALAFRAFHALADSNLRSSAGEPTYAVFGFTQIVLTALHERQPTYVAVSFDVGRTFRDDLYAEYKAGRAETPSEFHQQLERIKEVIGTLNIPIYTAQGYEADDVIGTLSRQASAEDVDTLILTGDTDTLQLVDDHVRVLLAVPFPRGATKEYSLDTVLERYKGLRPDQLADLRGLKGDTSDNIPGVKGIGEAGAISLLNTFGSVEGLYDALEGKLEGSEPIPNRYRKHLEGQRKAAEFSKHLATIVCNAPVQLDLKAATLRDYDRARVIALFQELEFGATLVKKLPGSGASLETAALPPALTDAPAQTRVMDAETVPLPPASDDGPAQLSMFDTSEVPAPPPSASSRAAAQAAATPPSTPLHVHGEYTAVTTPEQLDEVIKALGQASAFAFDTETDSLRAVETTMIGVSLAVRSGAAWYIPVGHREGEQLPRQQVVDALRPFFTDPNKARYGHNAKFDMEVLLHTGIDVPSIAFDTTIAAALLNKRQGLKDLAFYELGLSEPMTDIQELIGRGKTQITFDQVPIELATPYAAADADMTFRLVEALRPQLAEQPQVQSIFERLEMPLIPVLVQMEAAGIGLDVGYLGTLGERLGKRLHELVDQMTTVAGEPFNFNSGKQLNDVLFNKLQLPTAGLTRVKSGEYSITAEVLERFSAEHQIAQLVLQARQLTKLKSTYVDSIPILINKETGRVHTTYNQVGAATGRLSSNDPNLQNIPVRTQEGREIRRAFIAQPGHTFIAADYSQIELRVLAHITKDPSLVEVFMKGQDVHAATASQLFNVPIDQVDKNQRRVAKCVAAGTLISTEHGIVPIEQLGTAQIGEVSDISLTLAQEGTAKRQATGFYNGGVQPTIRITTERGYVLEATAKHQVRSIDIDGTYIWQRLGDLEVGEQVALARGAMLFGQDQAFTITYQRRNDQRYRVPTELTPVFARFLGYFVAEGNTTHSQASDSVIINNNDPDVLADLRAISLEVFGTLPKEYVDKNGVTRLSWHSSCLHDLLLYLGVGKGAANKQIPAAVMQGSETSIKAFLCTFFEGDGSISGSFISAGSKSLALIRQLQTLLLNFGIVCYLEQRDIPKYGRHYKLRIIGHESRELFAAHIGFISSRKRARLELLIERRVTNEPIMLPYQTERLKRLYPQTKRDLKETIHTCIRTLSPAVNLTYRRLDTIVAQFPDADNADIHVLHEHLERNLFYDRVAKIEHCESPVYDLVVPETNTYVANGFVSHNTVVFGVIYGISSFGLAQRTELSRSQAQELINALFERFPGLRKYIDETLDQAKSEGFVHSLFGRRRYFPELKGGGGPPQRRQAAEREAINAPIQATSADIMKIAMINVAHELRQRKLRTRMLLQVHDELIFEAPDNEVAEVSELVCHTMESAYTLGVPLKVDLETGRNWEEMEEVVT